MPRTPMAVWLCRGALVGAVALAAPSAARAQVAAALGNATVTLSAGVAFPSGGDLNDTYSPGPFVGSALGFRLAPRLALRLQADYSTFAPAPAPKHVERDSRIGYAGSVGAAMTVDVVRRGGRVPLYATLAGSRVRVGSTWLNVNNVVEPFSHAELWSWGLGVGSELTSRVGVEVQRLTAHRGSRGVVGIIPIGVRIRL